LYTHQEQAISIAMQGESYVVTTGTGSGKSMCFFIPIVSAILSEKRKDPRPRTRAIIIYPMNALANSQLEELDKFVKQVAGPRPVTYARYTGQEDSDTRDRVADNPPDILLTNFMMLELLMTRQDEVDRKVIANCEGLRFLVLDELHTYRGRQGADVALLVRRVRERLAPDRLQCIGTSATMASEGALRDKNRIVAEVASRLFSLPIDDSNVVVETLRRVTDDDQDDQEVRRRLGPAIDVGMPRDIADADLRTHPLAIWVERNLGTVWSDVDQRLERARPTTIDEAAIALAKDAGREEELCRRTLRDILLISSTPEDERTGDAGASGRGFFAFKLHQFISGAGHAFATLEPPPERRVTVEGQKFLPGHDDKRLYPVHFCRECGQEYHPVRLVKDGGARVLRARDIDDAAPIRDDEPVEGTAVDSPEDEDGEVIGFVTLHPPDAEFAFTGQDSDYPEHWLEHPASGTRMKAHYRPARVRDEFVSPDGKLGAGARAWFIPDRFRFCLRCRTSHGTSARDRNRLSSLSAEGRSSATTVLVTSALRWMHRKDSALGTHSRKLLGFTDNRQDAALQAGHFNDFLFVSLLRAGFLGALEVAGDAGLRSDELGAAQQRALGFDRADVGVRAEWLQEPTLKGFALTEAEAALRQVLAYRVWFDQRRGWRYTNPNLEQLKLVSVDYLGIDALAADDGAFASAPDVLRLASPRVRAAVYRELFDHLRKGMAVRSKILDATALEQLTQQSHSRLRPPWGFGNDEKPRRARWLMTAPPTRRDTTIRDEDLILRGGSRSALGKALRQSKNAEGEPLWDDAAPVQALKAKDFDAVIAAMLDAACEHGLVSEEPTPFGEVRGYRLVDGCVKFQLGKDANSDDYEENRFFRDLYTNLARTLREPSHPLFGFEAREHTAQVDAERRAIREKRFRYGEKEQQELAAKETQVREARETGRFLPVLFCSPTMELGVDISALNAVYLRNTPPTPANYAQRSGRAGRSGQAALVLTYCSSQSPHDQYFFHKPKAMVHGEVRPPLLDLTNRELVQSHLSAVWLASTQQALPASIAELLVLKDRDRPLTPELSAAMGASEVKQQAEVRIKRVLALLEDVLSSGAAPWYPGRDEFAHEVVSTATARFGRAFSRWRELFAAAEQQRDASRRTMDDYSAPQAEKRAARSRHAQAIDQLSLLQQGDTKAVSSDFYTYRYLATEGFLPGYNFPRLPLMAYVPATEDGLGKQTYLQRPRFLALSEFGPRSLVYHEGRAYRVVRAMISINHEGQAAAEVRLPTLSIRICRACGAGHFKEDTSICHACALPLGDAEVVNHLYRIENVATLPAERITANDEERQRQGFDLQTTFEWALRDGVLDHRPGAIADEHGEIARLTYGPGATITRLNKGLRRRADRTQLGFRMDPVSGFWEKSKTEDESPTDPTVSPRQWIVPIVQDRKNALLFRPCDEALSEGVLATLQHALLRGLEKVFQLEEGELLAEALPTRDDRRGFLLYEATEGGAGVLTRLVAEPDQLAKVAREALAIMHFDVDAELPQTADKLADVPGTTCVAACYRCLMSYYNQPDHELIDRRNADAQSLLLRLARAWTSGLEGPTPRRRTQPAMPAAGDDDVATTWYQRAHQRRITSHDPQPLTLGDAVVPLVWRDHYVAVTLGQTEATVAGALEAKGFEVIGFDADPAAWDDAFTRLATALGQQ
jgi:superfamily II DNA/RNA helicase